MRTIRRLLRISAFSTAVVVTAGHCQAEETAPPAAQTPAGAPVSIEAVNRAIDLAGHYILGACGPDGEFVYEIDTANGEKSTDYNIVRHAGAMYALATLERLHPDSHIVDALRRSATFLRERYVRPGPDFRKTKTLAVWTAPPAPNEIPKTTLGATGLGLVGLLGLETLSPRSIPSEDLVALGQFLRFMQKSDGRFRSKYIALGKGKFSAWGSLYYPGEAALALVSLYELDGSKKYLTASENALLYLAKSRAGAITIPADHWALIATAKLFSLPDQGRFDALRKPLVAHAVQICESILVEQLKDTSPAVLDGGFVPDGRTTPTSTRLEGLLATLEFLPPEHQELRIRIEKAVRDGLQFLLRSQIQTGRYAGGVPRAISQPGDTAAPKIRIDYVQHFLCAMIRYRNLFAPGAEHHSGDQIPTAAATKRSKP